jgi:ABC-2 type transport system ATP-binding protein
MEVRRQVGYLPETTPLYADMTVTEYLRFMGKLHGLRGQRLRQRVDAGIAACQLAPYAATPIGRLSKGYRQRVGIARAILHEPPVLILDEPTIGLDPAQVVETRELIRNLGRSHTVLLSTHIMAEVNALCQKVVILHEGLLVASGSPAELAGRLNTGQRIELEIRGPAEVVRGALLSIPGVEDVTLLSGGDDIPVFRVAVAGDRDLREALVRLVVERNWPLLRLTPVTLDIEDIFLQLVGDSRRRN